MPQHFAADMCGGRCGLFNAEGKDITVTSERPFDLKTLSVFTLWQDNAQVIVEGWEQQVRKHERTLTVRQPFVTAFDLNFGSIDRLTLKAGGTHMVVNPITVSFT